MQIKITEYAIDKIAYYCLGGRIESAKLGTVWREDGW